VSATLTSKRLRVLGPTLRSAAIALILTSAALSIGGAATAAGASALQFDGRNDYVTFGAAPSVGVTTFTLEAWVKRAPTAAKGIW
jgi:hypothetical protein